MVDQWGQRWQQNADGQWELYGGQDYSATGWSADAPGTEIWNLDDPNKALPFDTSPYQSYLSHVLPDTTGYANQDFTNGPAPNQSQNPWAVEQLFNTVYSGRDANTNPYATLGNRDALRAAAQQLGLTPADADKAALDYAQTHYSQFGSAYSEASHPGVIADEIAQRLFAQAGHSYQGLSADQRQEMVQRATNYQNEVKKADPEAWKSDSIAGMAGVGMEMLQGAWESGNNGGLPSEQALAGADNPLNTALWNKVLNKDWDPYANEYGLPTKQNYQTANAQGYDTGGASIIQNIAQQTMGLLIGGSGAAGEFSGLAADTAGVDPAYLQYGQNAKTAADYYKQYQLYQAGGQVNPGAALTAATSAGQKIGDFDSSAFTGGDSPYNPSSYFDESMFGTAAGGKMFDQDGNWIDGSYDQNGDFLPKDSNASSGWYDSTTNANTGTGFDEFGNPNDGGQGAYQDANGSVIGGGGTGGGSGGGFNLGSLFSGLGGGAGLGSLLGGGTSGGGNSLLAMAPILAAIQYARNQSPFDTSRLTGLADKYSPDAMAYQYDRNTEDQRRSLTSSLADRQVMGSSFGNMDISNFNTNRELGRGALISQASLGGADIANKILQAHIQQQQQKNQLYGSALGAVGNVFGARK